jgi:hypothetical protein
VVSSDHLPTPGEYLEGLRAEAKLARLDLHADLAELHDTETCPRLRRSFADKYRKVIGVFPHQREALRAGLERIRDGGKMSVNDLIAALDSAQPNGTSDDGDGT